MSLPNFPHTILPPAPDVILIDSTEWAEDLPPSPSNAPRPRSSRPEPCFCEPDLSSPCPCCIDESCALFACQEECGANCPAGPLCGNRRLQRKEWKELVIIDAGPKGRGLAVVNQCRRGDLVSEYVGVAVKTSYLDQLFQKYRRERMLYIMSLDGDVCIDARRRGGIARYINHSCEPNCVVHRWRVKGICRAGVFALKDIGAGEELSFDYQWVRKRGRALTKCHCGSERCRGTIEVEKDREEVELEKRLERHWIEYNVRAGGEILNRVVKVFFEDNEEYYVADVAQYDVESGKHQLMYRDMDDCWTDLSKEKWMLLDEEGEKYVIARKIREEGVDSLLLPRDSSPRSDSLSMSSSPVPGMHGNLKNYMYVPTPVKDAMRSNHAIFKCGQIWRVHIDFVHLSVQEATKADGEETKKAFAESEDGSVWKLVVTGNQPQKAIEYLEKVAAIVRNSLNGTDSLINDTGSGNGFGQPEEELEHGAMKTIQTEIVIPRVIVDHIKKKFFQLKGNCYNVDVTFTHSDSKSKKFAKLILSAEVESDLYRSIDLDRALEYLNREMTRMCVEVEAPMTSVGVFRELGFLGGELSNDDFRLLFESKRSISNRMDCSEDLQGSAFAASFEEANRCSIWIQSEEDMGRVSNNVVINEAHPFKPRKIFFGVAPNRVSVLWSHLQCRIADLKRGVQFLNLGADRIYQPILLQPISKNGRHGWNYFFDFVEKTSGASVRIDSITGNHLRIDGGDASISEEVAQEVNEKIDIAMEMISLQIELLRDHHIRQQRWGFGRDWALLLTSDAKTLPQIDRSASPELSTSKPLNANPVRTLDTRALGFACLEISDIASSVGLAERVAAHASIIFYRYTSLPSDANSFNVNFKIRDVQLASLFIANKSQKVVKWKRLEAVLDHAYRVFYPGSSFNSESEEAKNWERRVINAEKEVLLSLKYDVFWTDVDWIINAVVGTNALSEPMAENAMALSLSGHVLAAGPNIWLKYGPKYAFAAIAGFLCLDIEKLCHALSLVPLTVSHAAELIFNSCLVLTKTKKSGSFHSSKHELFNESSMRKSILKIQGDCALYMSKYAGHMFSDYNFVASPKYKEIAQRTRLCRVFKGVRSDIIEKNVLPILRTISFESKCDIRFSEGVLEDTHDIILEGNWKALSIAEHLFLVTAVASSPDCPELTSSSTPTSNDHNSYASEELNLSSDVSTIKQVKVQPGLLGMNRVSEKLGWDGTLECSKECQYSEIYDTGFKSCIAAQASQEHLDAAGLRWWVPHEYGPSFSGSLCDIVSSPKIVDSGSVDMHALALMAKAFTGGYASLQATFPTLASFLPPTEDNSDQENGQSIAISLQRWPPEKIEVKEQSSSGQSMQMGFSVAALQEMQLLHQLHFLIPSPQGHPNFILPLAIGLDSDVLETPKESGPDLGGEITRDATEQILAMIERNQRNAGGKQRVTSGSHLILEPTPLVLQKVINAYQRKNNGGSLIPPSILASLCYDILSAISFCHSNHIILRSLLPDQIHIDHSGTARLSGLSKVMVLHGNDRTKHFNPLKHVRDKKKSKDHNTEDVEPYAAPELLLGGTRHTKESDMWAFGAILAHLLLGKQLFPGKDRVSKMMQVFKIVGVPSEDNFADAKRFPFYTSNMYVIGNDNKKKKYNRGVDKALRHMLKSFGSGNAEEYSGLIGLLDRVLHLDPKQRITADEALQHQYLITYSTHTTDEDFRRSYVKDWMELKENVLTNRQSFDENKLSYHQGIKLPKKNGIYAVKESKRKAIIFEASSDDPDDDLYNLSDILGSVSKRPNNLEIL